jgi:hypothetical protein
MHTKPPIARLAGGERVSGGSMTAAVELVDMIELARFVQCVAPHPPTLSPRSTEEKGS